MQMNRCRVYKEARSSTSEGSTKCPVLKNIWETAAFTRANGSFISMLLRTYIISRDIYSLVEALVVITEILRFLPK